MLKTTMIPIKSGDGQKQFLTTAEFINHKLFEIECNAKVTFSVDNCRAVDPYKFMVVYDEDESAPGVATPTLEVVVIEASQDYKRTEDIINKVLADYDATGEYGFGCLSHIHKIGYQYFLVLTKTPGDLPRVKIRPILSDIRQAETFLSRDIEKTYEEERLVPFDSFMIDENHILFLCLS